MSKSTLALKATVTRRQAAPVPPDMAERLEQLKHHQAASAAASTTEPKARQTEQDTATGPEVSKSGKQVKREQHALQGAFLASNLNRRVDCYLLNGVKLTGTLREYDQFTLLLQGHEGTALVFKHAIATIAPSNQ